MIAPFLWGKLAPANSPKVREYVGSNIQATGAGKALRGDTVVAPCCDILDEAIVWGSPGQQLFRGFACMCLAGMLGLAWLWRRGDGPCLGFRPVASLHLARVLVGLEARGTGE